MKTEELLHKIRTQGEVYKPIRDYDRYMVSSMGNLKNIKTGRVLKPATMGRGYLIVGLSSHGNESNHLVHRLVAKAFIPNPENKADVNHKNEIKTDNRLENLEWLTHKDNLNYGTHNQRVSMSNKGKKRSEEARRKI